MLCKRKGKRERERERERETLGWSCPGTTVERQTEKEHGMALN